MKKGLLVGTIAVGILAFASAGTLVYVLLSGQHFMKNITFEIDGDKVEEYKFESLNLVPGASETYKIHFVSKDKLFYKVVTSFEEQENDELAEYVNVDIKYRDDIKSFKLTELYTADPIVYSFAYMNEEDHTLEFTYSIPSTVGNEAQGKVSNFNVVFDISHI